MAFIAVAVVKKNTDFERSHCNIDVGGDGDGGGEV